jgi:hypothetical protein
VQVNVSWFVEVGNLLLKKETKVERRKIEKMNQIRLQYIYTWSDRRKLPCSCLWQAKMSFFLCFLYTVGE